MQVCMAVVILKAKYFEKWTWGSDNPGETVTCPIILGSYLMLIPLEGFLMNRGKISTWERNYSHRAENCLCCFLSPIYLKHILEINLRVVISKTWAGWASPMNLCEVQSLFFPHRYLKRELIKDCRPFQLFCGTNFLTERCVPSQVLEVRTNSQLTTLSLCNWLVRQVCKDVRSPLTMIKEPPTSPFNACQNAHLPCGWPNTNTEAFSDLQQSNMGAVKSCLLLYTGMNKTKFLFPLTCLNEQTWI